MSAIQKTSPSILQKLNVDEDTYLSLKSSIFPGAKDESIAMALSYCRAAKLDIMQKPVHIVAMKVRNERGGYEYRDVVMPGITLYRIQASRTGLCAGVNEPEFGPTVESDIQGVRMVYPEWCKVTVKKFVEGIICEYSAKEFWLENFASNKEGRPNAMWTKRPFGQLAKCAESQAWRKAFPELFGGIYTAEEMEGKHVVGSDSMEQKKAANLDLLVTEDQMIYLRDKFQESETDEIDVLNHLKIGCLDEMKRSDFPVIIRQLERKIDKKQKSDLEINRIILETKNDGTGDTVDTLF